MFIGIHTLAQIAHCISRNTVPVDHCCTLALLILPHAFINSTKEAILARVSDHYYSNASPLDSDTSDTLRERVRAHHKLSRIYHPDQQSRFIDTDGYSTRMGLTRQETTEYMQCLDSAHKYLNQPSTQIPH